MVTEVSSRHRSAACLLPALFLFGATAAFADEAIPTSSTGDWAAGVFAGLALSALVAYALYLAVRQLIAARDRGFYYAILCLAVLWIVKAIAVVYCPGFKVDVGTYEAWALDIARNGPAAMYRPGSFLDYPPAYLYPLWAAGAFARWVQPADSTLRVITETPALAADFALAVLIFAVVRRRASLAMASVATAFFALNPTLLFDTVAWGQADSALALVMFLGVAMMLEDEVELSWALAALALLIKPQAIMLMPVLGVWTLLKSGLSVWIRSALAFLAVAVITVAPFQINHDWNWLPQLYMTTAQYYHETSVNAFNFMALIGGLRQNDGGTLFGVSYFALGMALLAPLYALVTWALWRNASQRNLWMVSFIALFGFFMLAPRMHERYLYAALVFAIPLTISETAMLGVFALVTATGLVNLAYVLHTLNTVVFLDPRDGLAMLCAGINCLALTLAIVYGMAPARVDSPDFAAAPNAFSALFAGWGDSMVRAVPPVDTYLQLPWLRRDTVVLALLVLVSGVLRFWHIGHPPEIVFDEVHFVGQARHYLHNEPFLDPHPPIAKLLIAAGILLHGDTSASWRLANATLGTLMVAITYLLGRRLFRSRLAAFFAAALVALDGYFIVDSRIGCIDIVYLTFAAAAYLLLFRFLQTPSLLGRRRVLLPLAVALGLCLGSKLYVPAITFLLVASFAFYAMLQRPLPEIASRRQSGSADLNRMRPAFGALLMTSAIAAMVYILSFTPHYLLGWWGGIADLFHYYKDVIWYEKSVASATHPYASPWWSWPLMLRPVAYWQNFPPQGAIVATIWGAGNPLTWWAVVPAMAITAVRALERPSLTRVFLVIGFIAYYVIWIPIGRVLFLYHYMPSVYIGYLALGGLLADFWQGEAELWEMLAVLGAVMPVPLLGINHIVFQYYPDATGPITYLGFAVAAVILTACLIAAYYGPRAAGRVVTVVFSATAVALFIYFLPVWLGTPISRVGYYARMWLQGPGLRNWI
ncbi:MAG TPA: phospholipid carrier-dependent glycosyltransferase [Candidatus Binataceae bacterium]|nr:phospholipid carrier-dependent glycosyltransferase [Candidatus Binataceae bacterium]